MGESIYDAGGADARGWGSGRWVTLFTMQGVQMPGDGDQEDG